MRGSAAAWGSGQVTAQTQRDHGIFLQRCWIRFEDFGKCQKAPLSD